MCRKRRDTDASDPKPRPSPRALRSSETIRSSSYSSSSFTISSSFPTEYPTTTISSSNSFSSASIQDSLREGPTLYPFSELSSVTNSFLSFSSSSWRCSLRNTDAVVLRRSFLLNDPDAVPSRLAALCKSNHNSVARLLGASLTADHIYLVYKYIPGANLKNCLRNPRNPNFTLLSTWLSRIQVAADLAQGLEYIHHQSVVVHNRIKSSGVIVTEPDLRAKICHFGAAELAGEVTSDEISPASPLSSKTRRSDSRVMRIDGTRGYIAPEVLAGGRISQKSDVFAFGVVLLELLSGEEPLKYRIDKERRDCFVISLIETARELIGSEEEEEEADALAAEERRGRVRTWVDRRLRDSFPAEVAEKLIRVALRCVESEAAMRPDMVWVAGKVSRLFLDSKAWDERITVPTDISVSFAPR